MRGHFKDELVVYHSKEDACWVAHSLRTDQIGTGDCIVDAMAQCVRAVTAICKMAHADGTIALLREAPDEIKAIRAKATKLPGELFEIAHKKACGKWPENITIDALPDKTAATFRATLSAC